MIDKKYENIREHRLGVQNAFDWLCKALPDIFNDDVQIEIRPRLRLHDLREDIRNDKNMLEHYHKADHHWQYWMYVDDFDNVILMDMPRNCIIEMICDWMAPFMGGDLYQFLPWYDKQKEWIALSEQTRKNVDAIIDKIREIYK